MSKEYYKHIKAMLPLFAPFAAIIIVLIIWNIVH